MAVYKPTMCDPFLSGVDARIGIHKNDSDNFFKMLTCQIDTSNKNITGYKIRLLDNNNNQIFPVDSASEKISPISELQNSLYGYESGGVNSGINGTSLNIPFFNGITRKTSTTDLFRSYNAIYYSDKYLVDHVIMADGKQPYSSALTHMENAANWELNSGILTYAWPSTATIDDKAKNKIKIDGNLIMDGDIILVAAGLSEKSGIWKAEGVEVTSTTTSGTVVYTKTQLVRKYSTAITERVTVLKGARNHNQSWYCCMPTATSTSGDFAIYGVGNVWSDYTGNTIGDFGCTDNNYKWEITLYQGNFTLYDQSGSSLPNYITYDNLDSEWLDMTLMSGKIMGTTPERIQVGGVFGTDSAAYLAGILPEGTDEDPLVLQEKYIDLSNSSSMPTEILSGDTRLYVKTYDATYGHVYPLDDALDTTAATNAKYCQFFEHSNDPTEILDTDIVNYTFTTNQTLEFYGHTSTGWTPYDTEAKWLANTSMSERYIQISETAINGIKEGDLILLMGQTSLKQNGVYSYFLAYDTTTTSGTTTTRYCIKRAASYDEWGSYIGKIIYTMNGDNISRANIECLASAGSYTLWNPLDTTTGSSSLVFVRERPILLFRSKLENDRTYNLFEGSSNGPTSSETRSATSVDGIAVQVGDLILYKDLIYGEVTATTPTGYTINPLGTIHTGSRDYFYILNGETMGKLVFKESSRPSSSGNWTASNAVWDLHTATILHNSVERTFISPWTGLKKEMQICLLNNKAVYYQKTGASSEAYDVRSKWIKVTDYNEKLFFVTHTSLSSVLTTITANNPQPLVPYDSSDESVPWRYDVRYFFRSSDENPFNSYETPYFKLYKDGAEFTDLSSPGVEKETLVVTNSGQGVGVQTSSGSTTYQLTSVTVYLTQSSIVGRAVSLKAEYVQFGQHSWESYEWILYDSDKNILQDTGKKYDKEIQVVFYGLTNDSKNTINYYAQLLIENELGDIVTYELTLIVCSGYPRQFAPESCVFTVTPDIPTQSNIIYFDILTSSSTFETYSIYRREYEVYRKPGTPIEGYYNSTNKKFYADSAKTIEITPKSFNRIYMDKDTEYTYEYTGDSNNEFILLQAVKLFKGSWEPVKVKSKETTFKDFNIKNNRCYQYIAYPGDLLDVSGIGQAYQTYANYDGTIWVVDENEETQGKVETGSFANSTENGAGVVSKWQYWSITELIPEVLSVDTPIIKSQYKVDSENIWLLKYSLETGSQTQNFTKEEFQSLGQFSKFGFGKENADSGTVTALLGSEIVPYSKYRYVERLKESRINPLSTNEGAEMLKQWNAFCFSKNPKLLKDTKGQSWIVQILSNSTTPQNFVKNIPETVSFQWKQVGSTEGAIIYGDVKSNHQNIIDSYGQQEWAPLYETK